MINDTHADETTVAIVMKLYLPLLLTGLSLFLSPIKSLAQDSYCSTYKINPNTGQQECFARELPLAIVPEIDVDNLVDKAEIVVLCIVDFYDPSRLSKFGPDDNTPAQMLERYLEGVRSLGDSERIKIFIVEGGEQNFSAPTRAKARLLHEQLGIQGYDDSIPVVYVFQKGEFIQSYTYFQDPGRRGGLLRSLVVERLQSR